MSRALLLLTLFLAEIFASSAFADARSDAVRRLFAERFPDAKVESIERAPVAGLYELMLDGKIYYVDESVKHVFDGVLIDAQTKKNITEERISELSAIRFEELPLAMAVKQVRGNGKRVMAVFTDPNCPYCKRAESELAKLTDVTLYHFLYPILSPDSVQKSKSVWCATDQAKVWNDLMLSGIAPKAPGLCETPIDKVLDLGRRKRITGTPTMFFQSGRRVVGSMTLADLQKNLDAPAKR
jgi:thiol:disulfide interchange protein DsbC